MTLLSRILTISKPPNLRSEAVGLDVVGASQLPRRIRRLIAAEAGMQPLADDLAVQDIDDLEAAELEIGSGWPRCGWCEPAPAPHPPADRRRSWDATPRG